MGDLQSAVPSAGPAVRAHPPALRRIKAGDRYLGPSVMTVFILGTTAAGQGMIGSVLQDPMPIAIQVVRACRRLCGGGGSAAAALGRVCTLTPSHSLLHYPRQP